MKLTYARLMVDSFDDCFEFYADIMGFEVSWGARGDVYASFKVNESVMLSIFEASLMDDHIHHVSERHLVQDSIMLIFEAEDVDGTYTRLKEKGVVCLNEPHNIPGWGIRCFHLRDPEGNLIEINQELPREQWSQALRDESKKYE